MKVTYWITLLCCLSCNSRPTQENFNDLIKLFPNLPSQLFNQNNYQFVRSIINNKNITTKLTEATDKEDNKYQIISIINSQGKVAHIALPPNYFKTYWQFQHLPDSIRTVDSISFDKSVKQAINQLDLNDTDGTAGLVLDDIFTSLLRCRRIQDSDSTEIGAGAKIESGDHDASMDSCYAMLIYNWNSIHKGIHPSEYFYNYNTYLDSSNNRIYQIVGTRKRHQKLKYSIRVY